MSEEDAQQNICLDIEDFLRKSNNAFSSSRPVQDKFIIAAIYVCVCSAGFVGNGLVILAVARIPDLRTLRNYFILNLACSDFLMCVITAPFTLYTVMNTFWPFGNLPCRLMASSQGVNIFVSTLTLAAIGLDRYLLIIFPVRFRSNKTVVVSCFIFVWLISFLLAAFPMFIVTSTVSVVEVSSQFKNPSFQANASLCHIDIPELCLEVGWEDFWMSRTIFSLLCFLIQYLVPLCVLSLLYGQIGLKLYRRSRSGIARSLDSDRQRDAQNRQRRTTLLLSSLVATFALCWLPFNLYITLSNFEVIPFSLTAGFVYCHLIGMSTACINPILYGVLNENFKTAYSQMLIDLKKKSLALGAAIRNLCRRQDSTSAEEVNCDQSCFRDATCPHTAFLDTGTLDTPVDN